MDRRAFKSVSTAVPSSHLVCGRWFSGPNTETFALIPLITLHWARKRDSVSPSTPGFFFYPKVHKPRPSFRVHFCCIDLRSVIYWVWSCYSFLPEGGVILYLFTEIHACSSLQVSRKAEDSSFFSLWQHCTCTSKALPCLCLVHVREHLLMHWDKRGRSHQHLPALNLCYLPMGKGQPLLATLEAILC